MNFFTQKALEILKMRKRYKIVKTILDERKMIDELSKLAIIKHIYPTDANSVLVKVDDAMNVSVSRKASSSVPELGVIVSWMFANYHWSKEENDILLSELKRIKPI